MIVRSKKKGAENSEHQSEAINSYDNNNEKENNNIHNYSLRQHRSNWRNKVFMTAISTVKAQQCKYVFHTSISQCIDKLGKEVTLDAVKKEMQQMIDKKVWRPIHKEEIKDKKNIIPSKLFLKEKYDAEGKFDKLKARLVAGGHRQDRTFYTEEDITSPTIATQSVFTIAAIAAEEERAVTTGDIPGAYLHADMEGQLYMILSKELSNVLTELYPEYANYVTDKGTIYVLLLKALYGCVESAKLWYEHLKSHLEELGFTANKVDPCVFNKGNVDEQCTIGVYVDDLIITSRKSSDMDNTINGLNNIFENIKWVNGDKHNYLGMTFNFDRGTRSVGISMSKYIEDLLKKYDVSGNSKTPCGVNLFDINDTSEDLPNEEKDNFHSAVASILFLGKRVRPDLLLAVSFLSSRVNKPTREDMSKLNKLLRYINYTKHFNITIDGKDILKPWISIDASYGVHSDRKSHSGVVVGIGGGGIICKSSKQKIVSKSSTEAEIVAVSDGLTIALHLGQFLKEQGYEIEPIKLLQDNKSTIHMFQKGGSTSERTRHIDIRHFWVTDHLNSGAITINFTKSEDMVADLLTKPLTGKQFQKLRNKILNWNNKKE